MTAGTRRDGGSTFAPQAVAFGSAVALASLLAQAVACSSNDDDAEASVDPTVPSAAGSSESALDTEAARNSPSTSTCSTADPPGVALSPFPTDPDEVTIPDGEGFVPDGGACPEPLILSDGQCVSCEVAGARYRAAFTALEYGGKYAVCTNDDDCIISGIGTNCSQSCGLVLAVDATERFTEATTAARERYCEDPEGSCQWRLVGCRIPGNPICVDGFCTFTTCQ